nr:hypothetical protein [Streptomyces fragilis]
MSHRPHARAVSYTHLDVYKRQLHGGTGRGQLGGQLLRLSLIHI